MKKIALIGAMGYGKRYLEAIEENGNKYDINLTAIVDISPNAKEVFSDLVDQGVKIYKSMEEMYKQTDIDLAIISSPIQYHSSQSCFAMEHGSHVMVEKPIAGCLEDAEEVIRVRDKTNKKILVGYQQIYDDTIRKVKQVILSGKYGKMLSIKCIVLWPRAKKYFNRNMWVGRVKDQNGKYIRDSVANNANAHHFMNVLYLAGQDIGSAANIDDIDANLSKVHDIGTFDTCEIRAKLEGDIDMLAIASHVTEKKQDAKYEILLENGYITSEGDVWTIVSEGKSEVIGSSSHNHFRKLWDMIHYLDDDDYNVKCTVECATQHTKMIEAISDISVKVIDEDLVTTEEEHIYVKGLGDKLMATYIEHNETKH